MARGHTVYQQLQEDEEKRRNATTIFCSSVNRAVMPQFESGKTLVDGSKYRVKLKNGKYITLDQYFRMKFMSNNELNQEKFSHPESKDLPLSFRAHSSIVIVEDEEGKMEFDIEVDVKNRFKDIVDDPKKTEKYDLLVGAGLLQLDANEPGVLKELENAPNWEPWVIPEKEKLRISRTKLTWQQKETREGAPNAQKEPYVLLTCCFRHRKPEPRMDVSSIPVPPGGANELKVPANSAPLANAAAAENNPDSFNFKNKRAVIRKTVRLDGQGIYAQEKKCEEVLLANGYRWVFSELDANDQVSILGSMVKSAQTSVSPVKAKELYSPENLGAKAHQRQALNLIQLLRFYCDELIASNKAEELENLSWIKAFLNFFGQYHKLVKFQGDFLADKDLPTPAAPKCLSDTSMTVAVGSLHNTTFAAGKVGEYQLYETGVSGLDMHFFWGKKMPEGCQDKEAFKQAQEAELALFHHQNIGGGQFGASDAQIALDNKKIVLAETDLFKSVEKLDFLREGLWELALGFLPEGLRKTFQHRSEGNWKKLVEKIDDNDAYEKLIVHHANQVNKARLLQDGTAKQVKLAIDLGKEQLKVYNAHMMSLVASALNACRELFEKNLTMEQTAKAFIEILKKQDTELFGSEQYLAALNKESKDFFTYVEGTVGFTFKKFRAKQKREGRNPAWVHGDPIRKAIESIFLPRHEQDFPGGGLGNFENWPAILVEKKQIYEEMAQKKKQRIEGLVEKGGLTIAEDKEVKDYGWYPPRPTTGMGFVFFLEDPEKQDEMCLRQSGSVGGEDVFPSLYNIYDLRFMDVAVLAKLLAAKFENRLGRLHFRDIVLNTRDDMIALAASQDEVKEEKIELSRPSLALFSNQQRAKKLESILTKAPELEAQLEDCKRQYEDIMSTQKLQCTETILAELCNQGHTIPDRLNLGGVHEAYLTFRIRVLFQKLFECNHLPEIKAELGKEISNNLETLNWLRVIQSGASDYLNLAELLMQRLHNMKEGEELTFATGWQAHAVALTFVRLKDAIAIRVDNPLHINHPELDALHGVKVEKNPDKILLRPAILGEVKLDDLKLNKNYFIDVIRNIHCQAKTDAIQGIRHLYFNRHFANLKKTEYGANVGLTEQQPNSNYFYKCHEMAEKARASNPKSVAENSKYLINAATNVQKELLAAGKIQKPAPPMFRGRPVRGR